jgi:excisionase family DNA binding protein
MTVSRETSQTSQTSDDPSTWSTKQEAADRHGVTTKTLERWAQQYRIRQARIRRGNGGPEVVVYHPGDVADVASRRPRAAVAGILVPDGELSPNGNGHPEVQALDRRSADTHPRLLALPPGEHVVRLVVVTEAPSMSQTMSQTSSEKRFLTIAEAEARSGLPRQDLRRLIKAGTLPAFKTARHGYRIRRTDLDQV